MRPSLFHVLFFADFGVALAAAVRANDTASNSVAALRPSGVDGGNGTISAPSTAGTPPVGDLPEPRVLVSDAKNNWAKSIEISTLAAGVVSGSSDDKISGSAAVKDDGSKECHSNRSNATLSADLNTSRSNASVSGEGNANKLDVLMSVVNTVKIVDAGGILPDAPNVNGPTGVSSQAPGSSVAPTAPITPLPAAPVLPTNATITVSPDNATARAVPANTNATSSDAHVLVNTSANATKPVKSNNASRSLTLTLVIVMTPFFAALLLV